MKSKILLGFFVLGLNLGVFAETPPVPPAPITLEPHPIICYGCCGHPIPPAPAPQPVVIEESCPRFIFTVVETHPSFLDGSVSTLWGFIWENMKFPKEELAQGIRGRVVVRFVVEPDGSISNVEVVRGLSPNLDKEALRIISLMPKWNPGKHRGRLVPVWVVMPVNFWIDEWLKRQAQNEE